MKKSGLVRMEVSLEVDNLVPFYYLSTSEIWADKRGLPCAHRLFFSVEYYLSYNIQYFYYKVTQMMNIDLLRQQQKWKDSLMDIRHMMAGLVQQVSGS
jgi:hypothetical protein